MDTATADAAADTVQFICQRVGGKMRVRITSAGYHPTANCQFPRALRAEGRRFSAPADAVTFTEGPRGTLFYRVRKSAIVEVAGSPAVDLVETTERPDRVFDLFIIQSLKPVLSRIYVRLQRLIKVSTAHLFN